MAAAGLNLLFEIFEDEKFDEIFEQFRVLDLLQKSIGRFKESVTKVKAMTEPDRFEYLEDSLTNLAAFIDYRLYDAYIN